MLNLPKKLFKTGLVKASLLLIAMVISSGLVVGFSKVYAQSQAQPTATDFVPEQGAWVEDGDVTFAGKNATRATDLIDYALTNYQWSSFHTGESNNPFTAISNWVRNTVYIFLLLTILVASAIIIITRGRSLAVKQFVGRFILVVVLIFLSFSIVQFIYQFFDGVQGFFLRDIAGDQITAKDLLYISFKYNDFVGYRKYGVVYDEQVSVSLLLVKITAATYYAMFLVLMIRKIILWFFIVISPIFPLLLLFPLLRNSAKIWMGEFFRWTLYGPLFALFLGGMVGFWQRWNYQTPLPLNYLACSYDEAQVKQNQFPSDPSGISNPNDPNYKGFKEEDFNRYPTAINILLGGPCQLVTASNNLNSPDSFLQYVVALVMLWAVILVPWLLLKIFLDYFNGFQFEESHLARYAARIRPPGVLEQYGLSFRQPPNPPPPSSPGFGSGLAKQIPSFETAGAAAGETTASLANDREFTQALSQNLNNANTQMREIVSNQNRALGDVSTATNELASAADRQVVAGVTGLSVPTMQDIVKYETGLLNSANSFQSSAHQASESLNRVAGVSSIMTPTERQKSVEARDSLVNSAVSGNVVAQAAVSAIGAINPEAVKQSAENISDYEAVANITSLGLTDSLNDDQKIEKIKVELSREATNGNLVAKTLLKSINNVDQSYHVFSPTTTNNQMEAITRISSLASASSLTQSEKVREIVKELEVSSKGGNELAAVVLSSLTSRGPEADQAKVTDLEAIGRLMSLTKMTNLTDEQKLSQIKSGLMVEEKAGNQVAGAILKTIMTAEKGTTANQKVNFNQFESIGKIMSVTKNPALSEQEKLTRMKTELQASVGSGNPLAAVMLDSIMASENSFPEVNKVQKVNLSDYEEVRKTWRDNYQRLEPPQGPDGRPQTNLQWANRDVVNIEQVISLLNSKNSEDIKKGRQMVASLLPFLLLGGFSKTEVIAYLKAKQEAAKSVVEDLKKQESDKDTMVEVDRSKKVQDKALEQTVDGEDIQKKA